MDESESEAPSEIEEEAGDAGGQEEAPPAAEEAAPEAETAPEAEPAKAASSEEGAGTGTGAVPVKARIICTGGEEPVTIGKALVPGGSPLHMEVPGAGRLVLSAVYKTPPAQAEQPQPQPDDSTAPAPEAAAAPKAEAAPAAGPGGEVKCLCPAGKRRQAEEQIKALATTIEQISSMQELLSDMQSKAQALRQQLTAGARGPQPAAMPVARPLPYDVQAQVPPGGREVFSAPGVGIYVVQKDPASGVAMGTGMGMGMGMGMSMGMGAGAGLPFDYGASAPAAGAQMQMQPAAAASCPACDTALPLPPPPDVGQRDWNTPGAVSACLSHGAESYGSGGLLCCHGGGPMVCCGGGSGGGMVCCGGHRVVCCGGGVGGGHVSCCAPRVNTCCGGGGRGLFQQQQQQLQAAGYAEQEQCQGDCTIACDSGATCMFRNR